VTTLVGAAGPGCYRRRVATDGAERRRRRARAQTWFADPALRAISRVYDDRETAASRRLSLEIALVDLGRPPGAVLDVGCGDGAQLVQAAERFPGARITGVDPETDLALPPALPAGADVRVVEGTAEDPGDETVARGPYDLVLVHLNWALWDDPAAGLARLAGLLAPGGLLYLVDVDGAPDAVEVLLRTAATEDESAYLRDQAAASFARDEAAAVVAALPPDVEGDVLPGGLGGAPLRSAAAGRYLGVREVRDALQAFAGAAEGGEQTVYHVRVRRPS